MDNIYIEESTLTPKIELNSNGNCSIIGILRPENPKQFFQPVFQWFENFFELKPAPLTLIIELTYFNTSSSKLLLDIFEVLEANQDKLKIKVIWMYDEDDDELLDAGEELLDLVDIDYELREI